MSVGAAGADAAYLPQGGPVAIVRGGAVWFDEAPIVFRRFTGGSATIGWGRRFTEPWLQSSAGSVAGLAGEGRFLGGVPPGPLRPIDQPEWAVAGGGCGEGWVPDTGNTPDFVVVGRKIISAATCLSGEDTLETQMRQPLFSHDVRGGEWRVQRWLAGDLAPVLAAEGTLLAVGEPLKASPGGELVDETHGRMRVSVVDTASGRTTARFVMPIGQLAFAAAGRLVLTEVKRGPRVLLATARPPGIPPRTYHSWLYSTRGRRIADLGTFQELPHVSRMHILSERSGVGESVLTVQPIPRGTPSRVVGVNARRAVRGLAFRWPALVLEETTAEPLPADQATCRTGYYSTPSAPFLQVVDLAMPHAYEPAALPSPLEAEHFPLPGPCPPVAVP